MEELAVTGVPPVEAMTAFDRWVTEVVPAGQAPVFVAFNASFDWMFVADAFERHLGRNPFGHAALDVKAYAMGATGSTWAETSMRDLAPRYLSGRELRHHALEDARDQAELFRLLRAERATLFGTPERTPS
jgi:DNA polymerase III epsilon subunit-like protein